MRTNGCRHEQKKANLLGVILNKRVFYVPEILYNKA